jgi:hypothetical protein
MAVLLIFTAWACSDSTDPEEDISVIQGRVTGGAGFGISGGSGVSSPETVSADSAGIAGAIVTARLLQLDGNLITISRERAETDANGGFLLTTDLEGIRFVILVATKDSDEWRAVVTSELRLGETALSPPLNDETTLEAAVYDQIFRMEIDSLVSYADIQSSIDRRVVQASQAAPSLGDWLAQGLEAFAMGEKAVLTSAAIGVSQETLDRIWDRKIQAQATLEGALNAAADDVAAQDALRNFDEAMIGAFVEEGVDAWDYGKSLYASLEALEKSSTRAGTAARMAVAGRVALRKSRVLDEAMASGFVVLGADESELEALRAAGESLRDAIGDAGNTGDLFLALLQYHGDVLDLLQDVREDEATIIAAMDRYITFESGLLRMFVEDVQVAGFREVAPLYLRYFEDVREFILGADTDLTQEQLSTLADLLILASLYE